MMAFLSAAVAMTGPAGSATLNQWGDDTVRLIRKEFYLPDRKLYGEAIEGDASPKQVAFNWSVGVMLTALNGAARHDATFKPWLKEFADAAAVYWNPKPPVAGFDVLPAPKPADRYYDDNEWMVLALVDTSEILNDPAYLRRAEDAVKFVRSGEDEKLGGGIYWRESDRASKNTCSNAPAAAAYLAVYRRTKDPSLLMDAKRIYAWTKKTLRDPSDGLMWDNINLNGRIGRDKWSYNTALMIRTATELARITGQSEYQKDADAFVAASRKKWLTDEGAIRDTGRFAHLLLESWTIYGTPEAKRDAVRAMTFLREKGTDANGHTMGGWERTPEKPYEKVELIDMASAARGYYLAADAAASLGTSEDTPKEGSGG